MTTGCCIYDLLFILGAVTIVLSPRTRDCLSEVAMKSQDIGLLLKLVSLHKQELMPEDVGARKALPMNWEDWSTSDSEADVVPELPLNGKSGYLASRYTARGLEDETGISKSQINLALNRCVAVGLAKNERKSGIPRANTQALFDFIVHGLKYVFPAKPGEIVRGITTAFAAPVLSSKLKSAGELVMVWPDARGNTQGQSIEPLFKSATYAVRRDPEMYAFLALIDAIRIGRPREANLAIELLQKRLVLN